VKLVLGCAGKVHADEVKKLVRANDRENMQPFQTGWQIRIKISKACDRPTTVCDAVRGAKSILIKLS
jgi:hypothetical protein